MTESTAPEPTKLWFLLDRSGSMGRLTEDVIGGFNTFIGEQAQATGSAHLTLVQFDSQAPFDIIHDAAPVEAVPPLTTETYRPRGSTPLLDAIGVLIQHADRRIEARSANGRASEDQLVVIFSDGLENASRKYNRTQVAELISARKESGWEFVFMGANQDAYLEAGRIGFAKESISNFEASAAGTAAAFQSISRATREHRSKTRAQRTRDAGQFYGGTREAEEVMGQPRGRQAGGDSPRPRRRKGKAHHPISRRQIPNLEKVAVGIPITRSGISFFPLYLPGNPLPKIATGRDSGLLIEELPDSTVPFLEVTNPTKRLVLIPEGEQLVGGLQDRVLNTSVLVAASSRLRIPVSCLEQGRWGNRREFDRGTSFAPRRTRRAKNASVVNSIRREGSHRSDQAAVWSAIDQELAHLQVNSETRAVRDAERSLHRDRRRARSVEQLVRLGPLPGQCGMAVTHGLWVVAIELFGSHDLLVPHWEGLVRSHLMERASASGHPSPTRVLGRIRRFAQARAVENRGVGLGTESHVNDRNIVGQMLTYEGAIVHASAFTMSRR